MHVTIKKRKNGIYQVIEVHVEEWDRRISSSSPSEKLDQSFKDKLNDIYEQNQVREFDIAKKLIFDTLPGYYMPYGVCSVYNGGKIFRESHMYFNKEFKRLFKELMEE